MWRRLTSPDENIAIELSRVWVLADKMPTTLALVSWIAFGIAAAVALSRLYGARLIDALLAFS
jgi:hypothetical protein